MYWYLSFLRPPPVSVAYPTKSITITPQVANDLRTEIREVPSTIHYVWQRVSPSISIPLPPLFLTDFTPPASTYKPVEIDLPKVQVGEKWRLGLFVVGDNSTSGSSTTTAPESSSSSSSRAYSKPSSLDSLLAKDPGVIGVWSEGIEIVRSTSNPNSSGGRLRGVTNDLHVSNKKGKTAVERKQNRISREWTMGVVDHDGDDEVLKIVEQTSFDLDKKIWDSGLALAAWLSRHLVQGDDADRKLRFPQSAEEVFNIFRRGGFDEDDEDELDILELGSGTGLVSIALAKILRSVEDGEVDHFGTKKWIMTATDLESAMSLMEENIKLNDGHHFTHLDDTEGPETIVKARTLDWDEDLPSWTTERRPRLIIAADVTYNTASFPALVKTLKNLLVPGPPLLLAYKQRDEGEKDLWRLLKAEGVFMDLIDNIPGSEDYGEVEIWVGRYAGSDA